MTWLRWQLPTPADSRHTRYCKACGRRVTSGYQSTLTTFAMLICDHCAKALVGYVARKRGKP